MRLEQSIEAGSVLLSPAVCERLRHPLRRALDDARRSGASVPPDVLEAIADVDAAGELWDRTRARADDRHVDMPMSVPMLAERENGVRVQVVEAAQRIGIEPRAVRARIERGTLVAEMVRGRWMIPMAEVERVRKSR